MRSTRLAAAANSPMQRLMSSLVMAFGTGQLVSYGIADGASGVQASGPSRIGFPPAAGGVVGPLRPACASCTPSLATPYCRQKSCTRLSAASFSSDHMPAHFGDTAMRLGRVSPRRMIGENRTLAIASPFLSTDFGFVSAPDAAALVGVHRHHQAGKGPEQAVFVATDIPQPLAGHLVYAGGGDQEMDACNRASERGEDAEDQADGEHDLDDTGKIHPELGRLEFGGDEETERSRLSKLGVDVRDQEQTADQAQDIEFIE